ncbi:uncharacterized protein DFL_003140 [Arthrobotrys flagrans]|uniref:Retrovirus-related Pol polyprotein from transposon TNT 1-94-like beta-barrel domain-containing protein n=1 Tax=Arthrobotrys flagrans TaxID=97331 RepID=A0A437A7R1_ARTFL|nr:hypothetical protein DFL_003140 [Arthrobotrys flagrans]
MSTSVTFPSRFTLAANGRNYQVWLDKIKQVLGSHMKYGYRLSKFIADTPVAPPASTSGPSQDAREQAGASPSTAETVDVADAEPLDKYEAAKSFAGGIIQESVHDDIHNILTGLSPKAMMDLLKERYRPDIEGAINVLENRLFSLTVQLEKYDMHTAVSRYFEAVIQIQKERSDISPSTFPQSSLINAARGALDETRDQHFNIYTVMWFHTTNATDKTAYTIERLRDHILKQITLFHHGRNARRRGKSEKKSAKPQAPSASTPPPATDATGLAAHKGNKRKFKRTVSQDNRTEEGGAEKRVRFDTEGNAGSGSGAGGMTPQKKNKITYPPCGTCGGTSHPEERCFVKHPELRPLNWRIKKNVSSYPTVPEPRDVTTVYRANIKRNACKGASGESWHIDSGASDWICKDYDLFIPETYVSFDIERKIRLGDDSIVPAQGYGTLIIETDTTILKVHDVLYAPQMALNLCSVRKLQERGIGVHFTPQSNILEKDGFVIAQPIFDEEIGLYVLKSSSECCVPERAQDRSFISEAIALSAHRVTTDHTFPTEITELLK